MTNDKETKYTGRGIESKINKTIVGILNKMKNSGADNTPDVDVTLDELLDKMYTRIGNSGGEGGAPTTTGGETMDQLNTKIVQNTADITQAKKDITTLTETVSGSSGLTTTVASHTEQITQALESIGETETTVSDHGDRLTLAEAALEELGTHTKNVVSVLKTTEVTQELANLHEYRCIPSDSGEVTSISLTIPSLTNESVLSAMVVFKAATSGTTFSLEVSPHDVVYTGKDVSGNTFTPVSSTVYQVSVKFTGLNVVVVVS